jgi:hypothetical protein
MLDSNSNTYIIKETVESNSYLLFVKEIYLILLIKKRNEVNLSRSKFFIDKLCDKKLYLSQNQIDVVQLFLDNINPDFVLLDAWGISMNGEILSVQLNGLKNLILINSTDRILRFFRFDDDAFIMVKEYSDSVNKKKWVNAFFYTYQVKNFRQDLIVSAVADANSLEFIFIDIDTGNYIKKLEPFKYQVSDFACHYQNHFIILLISNKKLFSIIGYMTNNWGAFAPQLKYIEENIEFIEEETFFDSFTSKLKKNQNQTIHDSEFIKNIFQKPIHNCQKKNLFFKYEPIEDDPIAVQSEKDLKELFQQFNEVIEFNKIN